MDEPTLTGDEEIELEDIEEELLEINNYFHTQRKASWRFMRGVVGGVFFVIFGTFYYLLSLLFWDAQPFWLWALEELFFILAGWNVGVWGFECVDRENRERLEELTERRNELRGKQYAAEDKRYGQR